MMLELVFCLILIAFCGICTANLIVTAPDMFSYDPLGAVAWPIALCVLLIVLLSVNVLKLLAKRRKEQGAAVEEETQEKKAITLQSILHNKFLQGVAAMVIYGLLLDWIGFLWSTPLFIFAYMSILGQKKIITKVITAIVATIALYLLFDGLLQVPLPRGYSFFRDMSLTVESLL